MMNRCVITPTYSKHFPYIEKYLQSFDKYLLDRDFPVYFIVDAAEMAELQAITDKYQKSLNIQIVSFDDVLKNANISKSSPELLEELGRLSFQTIKKNYSALYLGYEQFLILDSESIMIRDTNLNDLFEGYFTKPNFFVSRIADRPAEFREKFTYAFMTLASQITSYPTDYWTLESYNWFLELRILKKMIKKTGGLYERIREVKRPGKFHDEGIEGELLYYPYIIYTPGQFGYEIFDTLAELKKCLGWRKTRQFKGRFENSWRAHGGFLEGLASFVDRSNAEQVAEFIKNHYLPILRVSQKLGPGRQCLDAAQQLSVIKSSGVNILASSYTPELLAYFLPEES